MSFYDQTTWGDIAHMEAHGHLPPAASSAEEMREFYGDPSNGDYDHEHVAEVEGMLRDEAVQREITRLRERIAALEAERAELLTELNGEEYDGPSTGGTWVDGGSED